MATKFMWMGSCSVSKPQHFYFIRRRKDDSIVAVGTARECVKQMGLSSVETFRTIVSKNRKGIQNTYEIDIESVDEEEEC